MDAEGRAMPFDDSASALNAQTASRPERSFRAVTRNRNADAETHAAFRGRRGDSHRMQVACQLPEQSEQIFEKATPSSWVKVHQRQSAAQFELYPRFALH